MEAISHVPAALPQLSRSYDEVCRKLQPADFMDELESFVIPVAARQPHLAPLFVATRGKAAEISTNLCVAHLFEEAP